MRTATIANPPRRFRQAYRKDTIGRENLDKVTLTFQGSAVDDIAVYVEGPEDLRARVEDALRSASATPYDRLRSPAIAAQRSG